jgi:hypothetical protein
MAKDWWGAAFKRAIVLVLCLTSVSLATLNKTGTITLKSGEVYENVPYKIDKVFKVVKITIAGDVRNVSFNDIALITDSKGKDITAKAIGKYYDGPMVLPDNSAKGWQSEHSEVYRLARVRLWKAAISFSGSYNFPAGDYYEGIGSGPGFEGSIRLSLNHEVALRFMVSKTGLGLKDDYYFYSLNPDTTIISQDIGFSGIRYLAAVEYYRHFNKAAKDMGMWYIYAGLGAFSNKMTLEMTLRRNSTSYTWNENSSYSEDKFILSFGFGMDKAFTPQIGIELGAGFDMEVVGSAENELGHEAPVYAYIFDLRAGLVFFLN